jgi:hypothetical protein
LFHYDEVAEAEAQGLPYVLVPRELSREEWEKKYCTAGAGERDLHNATQAFLFERARS